MYCKQCGAFLPDDAAACPACGCLLAPAPAPETPAQGPKDGPAPEAPAAPAPEAPAAPATEAPAPSGPAPGSLPPARHLVAAHARPAGGPGAAGPGGPAGPVNGAPAPQSGPAPQPGSFPPPPPAAPLSPTVGTGEWLWSSIVAAIPIVGFIVLLVWAFGGGTKLSKRNWARANLILYAIIVVIYVLIFAVIIAGAAASTSYFSYNYYY